MFYSPLLLPLREALTERYPHAKVARDGEARTPGNALAAIDYVAGLDTVTATSAQHKRMDRSINVAYDVALDLGFDSSALVELSSDCGLDARHLPEVAVVSVDVLFGKDGVLPSHTRLELFRGLARTRFGASVMVVGDDDLDGDAIATFDSLETVRKGEWPAVARYRRVPEVGMRFVDPRRCADYVRPHRWYVLGRGDTLEAFASRAFRIPLELEPGGGDESFSTLITKVLRTRAHAV